MLSLSTSVRYALVIPAIVTGLGGTGALFWFQDWTYSLPTPRPANLQQPSIGQAIVVPARLLAAAGSSAQPLFIHVFNPNCPCSRFNLDHVRSLAARFAGKVRFVAILQEQAQADPHLGMPQVFDEDGSIAAGLGVYATPQAVILDASGNLYYRGNYNQTRYCMDARTEFARLALDAVLAGKPPGELAPAMTTAYGCPLPRHPSRVPRPVVAAAASEGVCATAPISSTGGCAE